ncbi:MAG: DUF6675 family protein [Sediminispirochaetaceae bacterium]
MIRACAALLFVLTISSGPAAAQEPADSLEQLPAIEDLFAPHTITALETERTAGADGINRFYTSEGGALHMPAVSLSEDLLDAALAIDYSVGVETLFLIPWDEVSPDLARLPADEFELRIYNILRSVSSLEGIEYYSASRERMRTLFAECWAIDNPDDRTRIPDPLVTAVPAEATVYIHQKDLTFGKNLSRVEYQHDNGNFRMGIVNLTTMTYMLFPIVGKENMSMQILVIPGREGILFYGLNTVKVLDLPIFYKKMESSFTNRMIALYNWFLGELGD